MSFLIKTYNHKGCLISTKRPWATSFQNSLELAFGSEFVKENLSKFVFSADNTRAVLKRERSTMEVVQV